jgi:hypothetical protein
MTDAELFGPRGTDGDGWTACPKGNDDGSIMLTHCTGHDSALLTVRGKDHDLNPEQLRALARAALLAADRIEGK